MHMRARNVVVSALIAGIAIPALAHGGSHPTPWPNPTPWPTYTGTTPERPTPTSTTPGPPPTPTPTFTTPTTPPPRPTSTPAPPPGPTPPTAPSGPRAAGDDRSTWEVWWHLNRWHYLLVERRQAAVTGGDTEAANHDALWQFLLERLGDDYFDCRSAACLAMGRAGHAGLAGWMQKALHDAHPEVRESACIGLGSLGTPMPVFQLATLLKDTGTVNRLRAAAALALGLSGDASAVPALRLALAQEPEDTVRGAAALALGFCGGAGSIPPLLEVARDARADRGLRAHAIGALGRLLAAHPDADEAKGVAAHLARLLRADRADHVRRAAVNALAASRDASALAEIRRAMRADSDAMVVRFGLLAAAEAARGGTEASAVLAELTQVLATGSVAERGFACLALGLLGDARAATLLRKTVAGGGANDTRSAAAIGLGLLRAKDAHEDLLAVARSRGDVRLRGYATIAVGMVAADDAPKAVRELLDTERDPTVRASAAIALGLTGAARDVTALTRLLADQSSYLRLSTTAALGFLRDDAAIEPIRKHFKTEANAEVRALLLVALGRIAQRDPVAPHHRVARWVDYTVRNDAVDLTMRLE